MSAADTQPGVVDRIKRSLVGLKMPMALEIADTMLRRISIRTVAVSVRPDDST